MQTLADVTRFLDACPHVAVLLDALDEVSALDGSGGMAAGPLWLAAGVLRAAVWDALHGLTVAPIEGGDVDVLAWWPTRLDPTGEQEREATIEARLSSRLAGVRWSVRNQARMHTHNGDKPYRDVMDAMRHWPETATAIAARQGAVGLDVLAPFGVADLVVLIVRPTPAFRGKLPAYRARVAAKAWQRRWPKLRFVDAE